MVIEMRITAAVLLIVLGLSLSAPPVARADTGSAQGISQASSTKTRKAYLKQQKKQQKQMLKSQKQARNRIKKLHPELR